MKRSLRGASVFVALLMGARVAPAQAPADSTGIATSRRRPDDVTTTLVARPMTVAAAPSTFRVLTVAVPQQLPTGAAVSWVIVPASGAEVLSARAGTIAEGSARRVLLTIRVARSAAAGRRPFARIRFVSRSVEVTQDVELDVAAVEGTAIAPLQLVRAAHAGDRLDVIFRVTNTGNAVDTLTLEAAPSSGWTADVDGLSRIVLASGTFRDVHVRTRVPAQIAAATGSVALIAREHGVERAQNSTAIEVAEPAATTRSTASVVASIAGVGTSSGDVATVGTLALQGLLTDHVRIDARYSSLRTSDPVAVRSAAALGLAAGGDAVRLSADRWELGLGTSVMPASAVTGQYVNAAGGSGRVRIGMLDVRAVVGHALAGGSGAPVAAASAELVHDGVRWTASMVEMNDGGATARALTAAGLGARFAPFAGAQVIADLAGRRYDGGTGVGASAEFRFDDDLTHASARVLHAPGGSSAFAAAENGLFADLTHVGGNDRWRIAANGWLTGDGAGTGESVRSVGASLAPSVAVASWLELGAVAQGAVFTMRRATESMGTGHQDLGGRMALTLGTVRWTGELVTSRLVQHASKDVGAGDDVQRMVARTDFSWPTELGVLGIRTSFMAPTATLGGEAMYEVGIERFRPLAMFAGLTFDASAQQLEYAGNAMHSFRAAANVALPIQMRLVISAQQDRFLQLATGSSRPVVSLKLERALGVTLAAHPGVLDGSVFQDRDGNGRRDAGEPGLAGIVVLRGNATAVTDAKGRYRIAGGAGDAATVDVRTLPVGWIATGSVGGRGDLAVMRTGRLSLRAVVRGSSLSIAQVGALTLVARHQSGREWVVTTDLDGAATFDALPTGSYTVSGEFVSGAAGLLVDAVVVQVESSQGNVAELVVHPRPVRVIVPGSPKNNNSGSVSAPKGATVLSPGSAP